MNSVYEIPITNRIRNFLRYEHLINRLTELIDQVEPLSALQTLHELIELTRYNDIKSELIQHLQWQAQYLQVFSNSETVNILEIDELKQKKYQVIEMLDAFNLPISYYSNHNFLNAIKLRLSVPAGTCNFDLPVLHTWLHNTNERISKDLESWKEPFNTIQQGIQNCLHLTRLSADLEKETADEGYYIKNFPSIDRPHTMVRIKLNTSNLIYPEVVVGKRHCTIHFFDSEKLEERGTRITENIPFELACCNL